MIHLQDEIKKPTGFLSLRVYKNDELVEVIEGENLIVAEASDVLGAGIISVGADDVVGTFVVGTGSGAAASGDTQATFTSPFSKVVATKTYAAGADQLTYTFTLEADEYNGNTIKEFGLMTDHAVYANKLLLARRVITGSIIKQADTRVDGTWVIDF